jgi:hypothetical protein
MKGPLFVIGRNRVLTTARNYTVLELSFLVLMFLLQLTIQHINANCSKYVRTLRKISE